MWKGHWHFCRRLPTTGFTSSVGREASCSSTYTHVVHSWPDLPGVAGKGLGAVNRDPGTTHTGGLVAVWGSQGVCPPHSTHMLDVCGTLSFTDSPEWARPTCLSAVVPRPPWPTGTLSAPLSPPASMQRLNSLCFQLPF